MTHPQPTVGVDVSKDTLEIAFSGQWEVESLPHEPKTMAGLVRRLVRLKPKRIVLEATGGLERPLARALMAKKLPVVIANPRRDGLAFQNPAGVVPWLVVGGLWSAAHELGGQVSPVQVGRLHQMEVAVQNTEAVFRHRAFSSTSGGR